MSEPKVIQLPPADQQAQDRAWKEYERRKFHPKRGGRLSLALVVQGNQVVGTKVWED